MSLLDWLTKRKKPLSQMTRSELRRQELLLEKERARLLDRVTKIARDKQGLFERGAGEQVPEPTTFPTAVVCSTRLFAPSYE